MGSKVRLMAGAALGLAAQQYPRLLQVVKEAVQNGLDAGATVIGIEINRKKREIFIRDNGSGVTHAKFENALQSVCHSTKSRDKLGQFGIGLIAALGKCREFTFTTCALEKGEKQVWRWRFICEDIKKMSDVEVPFEKVVRDVLIPKKGQEHGVQQWMSELRIIKYTDDRQIGRFDVAELRQEILSNFAVAMRERKAVVWVDEIDATGALLEAVQIRASDFAGKRMPEEKVASGMGTTTIRLFVVPRSDKRKGEVLVGVENNAFRVPFKQFAKQLESLDFLEKEVKEAFLSGTFEGEILHSKITLEANRKTFAEDDRLIDLCVQLTAWFEKTGREHIERAQNSNAAERLQDLGRRSLENLKKLFEGDPELAGILRHGDAGRSDADDDSNDASPKVRPEPSTPKVRPEPVPPTPKVRPVPPAPPENGRQRTMVRSGNQGLNFSHVEMDSEDLWRFDLKTVTLFFNITHPKWVACDRNDRDIMRLQEVIATHAITIELMPEAERTYVRPFLKKLIDPTVLILKESPAFTQGFGPRKS